MLNNLSKTIHNANREKGFYEDGEQLTEIVGLHAPDLLPALQSMIVGQRLALITSETSEVLEAERKQISFSNKAKNYNVQDIQLWKLELMSLDDESFKRNFELLVKDTKEDENADSIIRNLDFAGAYNYDVDFHVKAKMRYNSLRPYKHGKTH